MREANTEPYHEPPLREWMPWQGELTRFTTLCADCANGKNDSDTREELVDDHYARKEPADDDDDDFLEAQWHLIAADIYWEGPDIYCDHCNKVMASEYGDPEEAADTASKMIVS